MIVKLLTTPSLLKVICTGRKYVQGGEVVIILKILKKELAHDKFISILQYFLTNCNGRVFPLVASFAAKEKHENFISFLKAKTMVRKWHSSRVAAIALWCYNDPEIDSWLLQMNTSNRFSSDFLDNRNFDNIFFVVRANILVRG